MNREQQQLTHLAARASQRASFLGFQLAIYARLHTLTDDQLAERLSIAVERLANLRLCGRIRVEVPETCAADVRAIADKFGCNAAVLAQIVKGDV